MVGQLQRGAVTSSAGASEEALAPSDPTIYVDTMQPHILKGYNATVHDCTTHSVESMPAAKRATLLLLNSPFCLVGSMLERDLSFTSAWEVYCINRWFFA